MSWTSALAIYVLFWVTCAFMVLPFHARTHDEAGIAKIPGQADSAPANFRPLRVIMWTSLLSAGFFALYYANYVFGWLTPDMFDVFGS
jgi:predicted secreted protein